MNSLPVWVLLAAALAFGASLSLFVILVGRSMRASKSAWEQWEEDQEQIDAITERHGWLEKP